MKNINFTLRGVLLATAAMMVAATGASAQTRLKADIPFAFRAGGEVMPAGSYVMTSWQAESRFQLSGENFRKHIFLHSGFAQSAPLRWEKKGGAMLEFVCSESMCDLQRVWTGMPGVPARGFSIPKDKDKERDDMAELREIRVIAGVVK